MYRRAVGAHRHGPSAAALLRGARTDRPSRAENGYREYDEAVVDRVVQIRGLLDAGLPTRIIEQILPCLDKPRSIYFRDATPETIATLELERDRMAERIHCLNRNREAIANYPDAVRTNAHRDAGADASGPLWNHHISVKVKPIKCEVDHIRVWWLPLQSASTRLLA